MSDPPGAEIQRLIIERGWTQGELAKRLGRPPQMVNEVIKAKKVLTARTACDLERVLGQPAIYWLLREAIYRLELARLELHVLKRLDHSKREVRSE